MATYVTLIHFTEPGGKHIKDSPKRAAAFRSRAKALGLKVKEMLWTLGAYDGLLVFDAPDDETAAAGLLTLDALGNVRTQTLRAFTAEEMASIVERAFAKG